MKTVIAFILLLTCFGTICDEAAEHQKVVSLQGAVAARASCNVALYSAEEVLINKHC